MIHAESVDVEKEFKRVVTLIYGSLCASDWAIIKKGLYNAYEDGYNVGQQEYLTNLKMKVGD